jgi:Type I phosphodiesterase / nucleotide pyrophosphatase
MRQRYPTRLAGQPVACRRVRTFADIPVEVERLLSGGGHDRVGVILLDAFGRRFLERHAEHPFLRRLEVTELSTQFPSTTTAHVTTMHTGRPVGEHGLYEWNVYEPALDAIVTPLLFSFAGDTDRDTLAATGLDPATFIGGDTLYQRLAVRSTVLHPAAFSPSTYDRVATVGARLAPYANLREGVAAFFDALAEPGYAYLYWDGIDATGHVHGPDSREFDAAALEALDTLERGLRAIPGALLMVTADHGQVATDPERVDWLDELWPELPRLLTHRPAGSARDVFLHTRGADEVIAGLAGRLGEGARVRRASELVAPGPRLADVCVLPAPGRMAWLRSAAGHATSFRGHHGGLHPDETETWVGALYS